jgi:hypothetical protein
VNNSLSESSVVSAWQGSSQLSQAATSCRTLPASSQLHTLVPFLCFDAMDTAYDHIQEETFPKEEDTAPKGDTPSSPSLNTEFQEAWTAVSHSPWAATLGGFWGTVKKAVSIQ